MPPRRLGVVLFVCGAVLLVVWCARRDFARQGDGWEYLITTEAFVRHGSPEIRDADIAAVSAAVDARLSGPRGPAAAAAVRQIIDDETAHRFVVGPDGRRYTMHFWLYPLAAVPARLVLGATGLPPFNALIVTNALLLTLALGVVLAAGLGSAVERLALAVILAFTPVVWYVTFTGVEVFCWTFAVLSLVALDGGRLGLAAGLAAVAAMQNPPLVFLALVPAGVAVSGRDWRAALRALGGATVALLPMVFYVWTVGTLNPLTRAHVDPNRISLARLAGLLFDLDYGLLPYVPVVTLLLPFVGFRVIRRREERGLLLLGALAVMMVLVETQTNWNSAGMGLHRYLVWMLPVMTWLVVHGWTTRARLACAGAIAVTSGLVLLGDAPDESNWLAHRRAAAWAMRAAPAWYHPEFEVFAERSAHAEAPPAWMIEGRRDGWMELLPVAHGHASGEVTTLLVHADSAVHLQDRFRIDPAYWPTLQRFVSSATTPVYVHPPAGAIWSRHDVIDGTYRTGAIAASRVIQQTDR